MEGAHMMDSSVRTKIFSEGEVYVGEMVDGKRHGFGSLDSRSSGECFTGFWKNDRPDGVGILEYGGSDGARERYFVSHKNGVLCDPEPNSSGTSDAARGNVFLFVPNLIGYVRFLLIAGAFAWPGLRSTSPLGFMVLYGLSAFLDNWDGYFARKLHQTSVFGAWLDIVVDNISRSLLWCAVSPEIGSPICCLEWTAFVSIHSQNNAKWKEKQFSGAELSLTDRVCELVFRNGFRNFFGVWAIFGLHVLPVWLFLRSQRHAIGFLRIASSYPWFEMLDSIFLVYLIVGRLLSAVCEYRLIRTHITSLAKQ